jgi:hypothetical protein
MVALFSTATIAAKYEKDRKGNKEDVALLKKATCHVRSAKLKVKNARNRSIFDISKKDINQQA